MDEKLQSGEQLRSLYSVWNAAKWTESKRSQRERSFSLSQNSLQRGALVNQLHLLQTLGPLGENTHTGIRAHTHTRPHVCTAPYGRSDRDTDPELGGNMPV